MMQHYPDALDALAQGARARETSLDEANAATGKSFLPVLPAALRVLRFPIPAIERPNRQFCDRFGVNAARIDTQAIRV